jgi:hypothetical protein
MTKRGRGRPPLPGWMPASALAKLPAGVAVHLDLGKHRRAMRVRTAFVSVDEVHVTQAGGEPLMFPMDAIVRARVVTGLFESGDAVLRRGVPAAEWRGGVVRCRGAEVYVEQIDASFTWLDESELEHAEARTIDVVEAVAAEAESRGE